MEQYQLALELLKVIERELAKPDNNDKYLSALMKEYESLTNLMKFW